mmetsp:Transcript_34426/g.102258  ORF Transcript_34426/g.102258 Transcript_34426/m.102258 type:complete len:330 (+) Transcript_34426:346-1335(+)
MCPRPRRCAQPWLQLRPNALRRRLHRRSPTRAQRTPTQPRQTSRSGAGRPPRRFPTRQTPPWRRTSAARRAARCLQTRTKRCWQAGRTTRRRLPRKQQLRRPLRAAAATAASTLPRMRCLRCAAADWSALRAAAAARAWRRVGCATRATRASSMRRCRRCSRARRFARCCRSCARLARRSMRHVSLHCAAWGSLQSRSTRRRPSARPRWQRHRRQARRRSVCTAAAAAVAVAVAAWQTGRAALGEKIRLRRGARCRPRRAGARAGGAHQRRPHRKSTSHRRRRSLQAVALQPRRCRCRQGCPGRQRRQPKPARSACLAGIRLCCRCWVT